MNAPRLAIALCVGPPGILLRCQIAEVADTESPHVHAGGLEQIDLIGRAFRAASVIDVAEDRQPGPQVRLADRAKDFLLVRMDTLDGRADLPERAPSLRLRVGGQFLDQRLFALLSDAVRIRRSPVAARHHDVYAGSGGDGFQRVDLGGLPASAECRVDETGRTVAAGRSHFVHEQVDRLRDVRCPRLPRRCRRRAVVHVHEVLVEQGRAVGQRVR